MIVKTAFDYLFGKSLTIRKGTPPFGRIDVDDPKNLTPAELERIRRATLASRKMEEYMVVEDKLELIRRTVFITKTTAPFEKLPDGIVVYGVTTETRTVEEFEKKKENEPNV